MSTGSSVAGGTDRDALAPPSFKKGNRVEASGAASTASHRRGSNFDVTSNFKEKLGSDGKFSTQKKRIFTEASEHNYRDKESVFRTQTDEYYQGKFLKPSIRKTEKVIRSKNADKTVEFKIKSRNSSTSRSRHSFLGDELERPGVDNTITPRNQPKETKGFKSSSFVVPGELRRSTPGFRTSSQRHVMIRPDPAGYEWVESPDPLSRTSKFTMRSRSTEPTKEGLSQPSLQAKTSSNLEFSSKPRPVLQLREEQESLFMPARRPPKRVVLTNGGFTFQKKIYPNNKWLLGTNLKEKVKSATTDFKQQLPHDLFRLQRSLSLITNVRASELDFHCEKLTNPRLEGGRAQGSEDMDPNHLLEGEKNNKSASLSSQDEQEPDKERDLSVAVPLKLAKPAGFNLAQAMMKQQIFIFSRSGFHGASQVHYVDKVLNAHFATMTTRYDRSVGYHPAQGFQRISKLKIYHVDLPQYAEGELGGLVFVKRMNKFYIEDQIDSLMVPERLEIALQMKLHNKLITRPDVKLPKVILSFLDPLEEFGVEIRKLNPRAIKWLHHEEKYLQHDFENQEDNQYGISLMKSISRQNSCRTISPQTPENNFHSESNWKRQFPGTQEDQQLGKFEDLRYTLAHKRSKSRKQTTTVDKPRMRMGALSNINKQTTYAMMLNVKKLMIYDLLQSSTNENNLEHMFNLQQSLMAKDVQRHFWTKYVQRKAAQHGPVRKSKSKSVEHQTGKVRRTDSGNSKKRSVSASDSSRFAKEAGASLPSFQELEKPETGSIPAITIAYPKVSTPESKREHSSEDKDGAQKEGGNEPTIIVAETTPQMRRNPPPILRLDSAIFQNSETESPGRDYEGTYVDPIRSVLEEEARMRSNSHQFVHSDLGTIPGGGNRTEEASSREKHISVQGSRPMLLHPMNIGGRHIPHQSRLQVSSMRDAKMLAPSYYPGDGAGNYQQEYRAQTTANNQDRGHRMMKVASGAKSDRHHYEVHRNSNAHGTTSISKGFDAKYEILPEAPGFSPLKYMTSNPSIPADNDTMISRRGGPQSRGNTPLIVQDYVGLL